MAQSLSKHEGHLIAFFSQSSTDIQRRELKESLKQDEHLLDCYYQQLVERYLFLQKSYQDFLLSLSAEDDNEEVFNFEEREEMESLKDEISGNEELQAIYLFQKSLEQAIIRKKRKAISAHFLAKQQEISAIKPKTKVDAIPLSFLRSSFTKYSKIAAIFLPLFLFGSIYLIFQHSLHEKKGQEISSDISPKENERQEISSQIPHKEEEGQKISSQIPHKKDEGQAISFNIPPKKDEGQEKIIFLPKEDTFADSLSYFYTLSLEKSSTLISLQTEIDKYEKEGNNSGFGGVKEKELLAFEEDYQLIKREKEEWDKQRREYKKQNQITQLALLRKKIKEQQQKIAKKEVRYKDLIRWQRKSEQ